MKRTALIVSLVALSVSVFLAGHLFPPGRKTYSTDMGALQNPVQQQAFLTPFGGNERQLEEVEKLDDESSQEFAGFSGFSRNDPMTPTGFEPVSRP